MKSSQHARFLFPSLLIAALCLTISCKQVTQAIDNLLTFNLDKSVTFPVYQYTPTGILTPNIGIPIPLDSTELAKQKTAYEINAGDWSSDVCSSDLFFMIISGYGMEFVD